MEFYLIIKLILSNHSYELGFDAIPRFNRIIKRNEKETNILSLSLLFYTEQDQYRTFRIRY